MKTLLFSILLTVSTLTQASLISSTDDWRGKWGEQTVGVGATITYSLMETGTSCERLRTDCTFTHFDDFLPTGWNDILTGAFSAWSAVADVTFVEVADEGEQFNDGSNSGTIRIGGREFDGINGTIATAYYPGEGGAAMGGDLHLDTAELWDMDIYGDGFDLFTILTHEIGHNIGLKHSDNRDSLLFGLYHNRTYGIQDHEADLAAALYGSSKLSQRANQTTEVSEPKTLLLFAIAFLALFRIRNAPFRLIKC